MDAETEKAGQKKLYEVPRLTTISLRPEEAVLGHCKISGQSMPGSICGFAAPCPNAGS
jgi:hypothetical protein